MPMITWNTDVNAPCCPGEILSEGGKSILIQTDWDYPGVATSFGWSIASVQNRLSDDGEELVESELCDHSGTDGTIDCKECGMKASQFIQAAGEWLEDNDGATAEDPGYFGER